MRRPLLASALVVATVGIFLGVFVNNGLDRLWPLSWLAWAPVGYLILAQRRGNKVGVAALVVGVTWGFFFTSDWVVTHFSTSSMIVWVDLVTEVGNPVPWLAIFWLLLVFPSGEYPGRSERVLGWGILGYGTLAAVAFLVSPVEMFDSGMPSPLAVSDPGPLLRFAGGDSGFLPVIAFFFTTLVLLVLRWRRSAGVERLQYRWLFLGASLFVVVLAIGNLLAEDNAGQAVFLVAGWAIPVCIGVAVLRYRLYDIDRLISRTVSYALVVAVLGAIYLGSVTLITSLLPSQNALAVAGSTLAVAAVFNPFRKRIQHVVDRRFDRSGYQAEKVSEEFASRLRESLTTEQLVEVWEDTVETSFQPTVTTIWLKQTDTEPRRP